MLKYTLLLPLAFVLGLTMFSAAHADDSLKNSKPTVVLVHGAFADVSSWSKVIALLQARGVQVVVVQNSLDSLASDVAQTRRVIANQPGRVVLVGHSWGGTVITEAGGIDQVAALVYIAAFAPDAGQSTGELGKNYPAPPGLAYLVPDQNGYLSLSEKGMKKHFAQDLRASEVSVMLATQSPINGKAFDEKVSTAAWKTKPSWYIVSDQDHMISPYLERDLAKKIGAKITHLPTSHVPMQSRPADVAMVILAAVEATAK